MLRIVAVVAVIMLHAAAAGFYGRFEARTVYWQICNFYNSLVRFCVPVFVMVSGMFLLNPEREYGLKKLYFSKILRIATAYIFWAAFYSLIPLIGLWARGGEPTGHGYIYSFVHGIVYGHYHLWFLFMISGLYMVTPFLRMIAKNEKLTIYFLALGLVFIYGTKMLDLFSPTRTLLALTFKRMNVQLLGEFSCYFLWGNWLSRHSLPTLARRLIYICGIIAAVGTAVLNGLAGYHFNVAGTWMYPNMSPNVLMMATAVFVFCQYHFQGRMLPDTWKSRIGLVGRLSFGIYLVHIFFLEHLQWIGLPHFFCHPLASIPITTMVAFCSSLAVVYVLDKIPVLNKYVM